jgi:DNA-binding CsgD family transcriptional regulator
MVGQTRESETAGNGSIPLVTGVTDADPLTDREGQVLRLAADGLSSPDSASSA